MHTTAISLSPQTRRIARLFGPHRRRLGAVLGVITLSARLGMISPFLLRAVLDQAIPEGDTTLLAWLVGGMIAISIATGAWRCPASRCCRSSPGRRGGRGAASP